MSQLSYDRDQSVSFAGMKADARFDEVISRTADNDIPFGSAVGAEAGEVYRCRVFTKDNCSLLYDADFVTSNKINGTVNGVAWTEVDFTTDHDTTAGLVRDAINALAGVTCILDTGDANNRTFLIEMEDGSVITVTTVVTGGASQATGTPTYSSDDVFRGIALAQHKEQTLAGITKYTDKETVSVLKKGTAWVPVSVAVTADDTAYALVDGTGKFTNASSGNTVTGGKFRSSTSGAGLAKLDINLP